MGRPVSPLAPELPPNDPLIEETYRNAPDRLCCEIINGFLMMSPRPRTAHSRAASRLGMLLGGAFDTGDTGPGGWIILDEPEIHLGSRPDKMGPDLAGWRRARMPEMPLAADVTLTPDWVCEVLSPSTEVTDRGIKIPIYEREGVAHVWLVSAEARTLEVFALREGRLRPVGTHADEARVRAAPFDAIELDLARLWQR